MEKELNCSTLFGIGMEISSEQLPNCYLQPNWEMSSIDQNDPFESALSSMVSSPTGAANGGDVIPGDGMMIRELIGRLGSICDSGDISPESCINSTNTSCYSTPLNSPPKRFNLSSLIPMQNNDGNFPNHPPSLASLNADPGFVERAAKFSCFGNNNFGGGEMGMKNYDVRSGQSGKLSRVSSNLSMKASGGGNLQIDVNSGGCEKKFGGISRASTPENGDSREGSSVSQNDANSRKRKSIPKTNLKDSPSSAAKNDKVEAENEESNVKRSKTEDEQAKKENAGDSNKNNVNNNSKEKQNNNKNSNDNKEASKPEPPKDYIHVRARRGQATDSHSLAERVRREKISERMKLLQDLVPGCNKVTGKALMLDEIINYVQSLQRQVEFLSMKLASVNPRLDFNMDNLFSKDVIQPNCSTMAHPMYPLDSLAQTHYGQPHQNNITTTGVPCPMDPLNPTLHQNHAFQLPPLDAFPNGVPQIASLCEGDLQSIVQMGYGQKEGGSQSQALHGTNQTPLMKIEF